MLKRARIFRPNLWPRFFLTEDWSFTLTRALGDRIRLREASISRYL